MKMLDIQKKDIHNTVAAFKNALLKLEKEKNIIEENRQFILRFIRDCRLGKTLKKKQKKIVGEARCLKYIYTMKRLSEWLDKPFDQVTQDDMEKLIEGLANDDLRGTIRGRRGQVVMSKKLAPSTKTDYKKSIKKFYKWLLGNNDHYPELVDMYKNFYNSRISLYPMGGDMSSGIGCGSGFFDSVRCRIAP